MKKLLLGAAAALAISAPGIAAAQSGYIDGSYQTTDAEIGGVEGEGDGWTVGGAAAWGGNGSLGFQVDGLFGSAEDVDTYNIGGHLFTRNDSHLIGGFANFGNSDVDGVGDFDIWSAGLEGQLYLDRTTINAALSYSDASDVDINMTALEVGLTAFASDNFSISGSIGYGLLDYDIDETNALSYGVGAEWQFASAPISIFGGWQHLDIDDFDADADTLSLGVRYNFGGTLFERNRSGASLARGGGLSRFAGLL